MSFIRRSIWPGMLYVLIGASVAVHVIMFMVIHAHPGMTQDLRKVETAPAEAPVGQARETSKPHD